MSIYTHSERTDKKYPLNKAVLLAQKNLKDKGIDKICMDAIPRHRQLNELVTLEEVNVLAEKLLDDTLYWEGYYHGYRRN